MSSTNRNGLARHTNDYYQTPSWFSEILIGKLDITRASEGTIVDAGCGDGEITAALAPHYPMMDFEGVDIDPELIKKARERNLYNAAFNEGSFLNWSPALEAPDLIVMNPPYVKAIEFVDHALKVVKTGGNVAALLRLNFIAGIDKFPWMQKHMPRETVVSAPRPSFNHSGTDSTEYAWFIWGVGVGTQINVVNPERPDVRKINRKKRFDVEC